MKRMFLLAIPFLIAACGSASNNQWVKSSFTDSTGALHESMALKNTTDEEESVLAFASTLAFPTLTEVTTATPFAAVVANVPPHETYNCGDKSTWGHPDEGCSGTTSSCTCVRWLGGKTPHMTE